MEHDPLPQHFRFNLDGRHSLLGFPKDANSGHPDHGSSRPTRIPTKKPGTLSGFNDTDSYNVTLASNDDGTLPSPAGLTGNIQRTSTLI